MLPHRIVRASAGSGKTHRLASRYIELLHRGAAPETILAATFTRKAAGEILSRILTRLAQAALDPRAARRLTEGLSVKVSRPQAQAMLRRLCDSLHRVSVSTLDAFFYRVVRMMTPDGAQGERLRITSFDDALEAGRRRDALDATLRDLARDDWRELLTMMQRLHRESASRSVAWSLDLLLLD